MHVLLDDDLGRLTVRRLRPWHRWLARGLATRLDRQLADGVPARGQRDPGRASHVPDLRRVPSRLGREPAADSGDASASPDARPRPSAAGVARPPHVQLRRDRIARSASELAGLAGFLAGQGPVPAQGVAMVSQLLADGGGPLYRAGSRDDLNAIIERASQALIR